MMERINKENYEAYFLDFVEGNLSASEVDVLNGFLAQHPELKSELKEFEELYLPDAPIENKALKTSLKREESTGLLESEYLLIAQAEGIITADEKARLAALVATNPQLLEDLAIYHKTKLPAEERLVFDGKQELLQKEKGKVIWWRYATAAAAILVIVLFRQSPIERDYNPRSFAFETNLTKDNSPESYAFVKREQDEQAVTSPAKIQLPKATVPTKSVFVTTQRVEKPSQVAEQELPKTNSSPIVEPIDELANEEGVKPMVLPEDSGHYEEVAIVEEVAEEEYISIGEFAKDKIKSDLLRGKTFSETILEELTELAEEKIDLETKRDQEGEVKQLSFNIGKFSFSRSR